jgi:hypothetical protein
MSRSVAGPLVLVVALACRGADSPPFEPVADVKQLMTAVLEPAAEVYWDAVGSVSDERGTTEFAPETDEEWAAVRNAAYVIAESGNLLMMEGRVRDRGDWITYSRGMVAAGRRALGAAELRNADSVFAVGGEVYEACTACHATYAVGLIRPNTQP